MGLIVSRSVCGILPFIDLPLIWGNHYPSGSVKNLPAVQETQFNPWVGKIPWRREWQATPVFLPGESQGEEPGGLQSVGLQKSDITERFTLAL